MHWTVSYNHSSSPFFFSFAISPPECTKEGHRHRARNVTAVGVLELIADFISPSAFDSQAGVLRSVLIWFDKSSHCGNELSKPRHSVAPKPHLDKSFKHLITNKETEFPWMLGWDYYHISAIKYVRLSKQSSVDKLSQTLDLTECWQM